MLKTVIFILVIIPSLSFGQTKFTSSKYNYTFVIPDGWHVKDKIYNPDVDAKIVDGKGNSFVISIVNFPTSTTLSAPQENANVSNSELEAQFDAVYGNTKIVKRGSFSISFKDFFFIHLLTPFENGGKLYHKQFFYNEGYKVMSIDACSIETYLDETSPAFAIMLNTLKFNNLKTK